MRKSRKLVRQPRLLWPLLVTGVLVFFPFDWLSQVWPLFGQIFDHVFVTARDHAIGHATLFFIAASLMLWSVPVLRCSPMLYLAVMMLGAFGEESLQSLFKLRLPTFGDGRDLVFDFVGIVIAYTVMSIWQWIRDKRRTDTGHVTSSLD